MARPARKSEAINDRVVILLRKSERKYVEKLAALEKVSAGEIFRRSLEGYQTIETRLRKQQEEELLHIAIAMIDSALLGVNESITETCKKLDKLHLALKKRGVGMSVSESFFSAAKQFLLATENLKRLDEKVSRLTDDINGINLRLVRVETVIVFDDQPRPKRRLRTLRGEKS